MKSLSAQQYLDSIKLNFETFTIKDGLSQGMVRSMIQDKEGYMWFATKDGLNKYDGYHVTVYRNDSKNPLSLQDNYITKLAEDDNGNLWVGTSTKGLFFFDRRSESFYPFKLPSFESFTYKEIKFLECRQGKLVVASSSNLFIYDISQINSIHTFKSEKSFHLLFEYSQSNLNDIYKLPLLVVGSITWMPDGKIWILRPDRIFMIKPNKDLTKWEVVEHSLADFSLAVKNPSPIYAIKVLRQNKYVIQSNEWLAVYNDSLHKLDYILKTDNNQKISSLLNDTEGNIRVLISSNYYLFDPYSFRLRKISTSDKNIDMNNASWCLDKDGILWWGTGGYGVVKCDPRKQLFHAYYSDRTQLINTPAKDPIFIKKIWPQRFNRLKDKFEDLLPTAYQKFVFSYLVIDKKGIIWLKANTDNPPVRYLFSYNPITQSVKQYDALNLYPGQFESLFIDNDNRLWVLFYNLIKKESALRRFNETQDTYDDEYVFSAENNFSGQYNFISQCWQDANGFFWLATVDGLIKIDMKKKKHLIWKHNSSDSNSISTNTIFSICPDPQSPDQYLWVGTNGGGLNRFEYKSEKFLQFTEKDGLPNNVIYGILTDQLGHIWMSTNKGLSCFSGTHKLVENANKNSSPKNSMFFRNYDEEDGVCGTEFNRYEFAKLNNNELAFGGVKGFTIFNPSELLERVSPPSIVLSNFRIFNKVVDYKTNPSIIAQPIQYASTITLPYDQNMFTIEFAGLSYSSIDKKNYFYFLEGFNQNWIDNGALNFANFTNLDPGEYKFNVVGSSNGGDYSVKPASIKIIILPPWWGTWWFRSFVLFIIASSIYGLYRYRLQEAFNLFQLRNRIASDLHDEIGSTISSISLSSTIIQNKLKNDSNEVNSLLNQISQNTTNIMESMNDIVWAINTKNDRFDNVINRMRSFAVEMLEPKDYIIHFNVDENLNNLKLDMAQRKNLYLIFKEAVNNIAKYALCNHVWIDIKKYNHQQVLLSIKDDGIGFTTQANPTINEAGKEFGGNGLSNLALRAKELHGELKIISAKGNGTEVQLIFKP